ncbi:hypothetical protein ACP70R_042367 [Stipagrostis hirtigluma subsp. patula]
MDAMELDVNPPPQVACTDDQMHQLAGVQRGFGRIAAQMAEIGGLFDEINALIDAVSAQARELRRLRATTPAADIAGPLREIELAFARIMAVARQAGTVRASILEVGRAGVEVGGGGGGGGETVDALAAALQRIHIDLTI